MPGISRRQGVFAYAKQTAIGAAVADAAAKFALPQVSGGMRPVRDRADLALTSSTQQRRGQYVQRARGEGTITVLGHPNEIGLLLLEAMGSDTVSGSGPTYTHTFTMNDALPNPMTVWTLVGDDWWRFADTYIQRMTIRGASGENVTVEMDLLSYQARRRGSGAGLTYTQAIEDPRFKYIGSVVQMEADSATPATMTNVENVELVIDRALELRYGASLTPTQHIPMRNVDFSAGIVYDAAGNQGWDFLTGAHLGSVTAVTGDVTQNLIKGSFNVNFGIHPSTDASDMTIASNGAAWQYGVERPDPDPAGGPLEMDIAGPVVSTPGTTEVTVTLINTQTGTY